MFALSNLIPNDGAPSLINEVCFRPDGTIFGANFQLNDEIRLYDARTLCVVRVLRNPDAMLNKPHGLLLTANHLIVANKGVFPSEFRVFRLDDESGAPVHTYVTPYAHLAEGHSMALHGRRLVVTYCEGRAKKGALVSYDFDDGTGRITAPLDKQEAWFSRYGDAKGVSFDETGAKVYVTFQSDFRRRHRSIRSRVMNAMSFGVFGRPTRNGIAVFGIDPLGRFTRNPLLKKIFRRYCRLENIHVCGNLAVVTNPGSACVQLYDLRCPDAFEAPLQVIRDALLFPHGAKLSPDGNLLVVTDNGIQSVNHRPQWGTFVSPRMDRLVVYKLQPA